MENGHIYLLLSATYTGGWMGFLTPSVFTNITQTVAKSDILMRVFTLVVECGVLFFVCRRSFTLAFLIGWIALQLGIVFISGIFFWKWILMNVSLFILLWQKEHRRIFPVFTREHFLLSLILISGGLIWYQAHGFSWYDDRINYAYKVEAQGVSGQTCTLTLQFFSPYDFQVALMGLGYLVQEPSLRVIYGAVLDREVADRLVEAKTPEDVLAIEEKYGHNTYWPKRAEQFDNFLITMMQT